MLITIRKCWNSHPVTDLSPNQLLLNIRCRETHCVVNCMLRVTVATSEDSSRAVVSTMHCATGVLHMGCAYFTPETKRGTLCVGFIETSLISNRDISGMQCLIWGICTPSVPGQSHHIYFTCNYILLFPLTLFGTSFFLISSISECSHD